MSKGDLARPPVRRIAVGLGATLIAATAGWAALVAVYVLQAVQDQRHGVGVDPLDDVGLVILLPSIVSVVSVAMAAVAIRYRGRWSWPASLPYMVVFGLLAPIGFGFAFDPRGLHHSRLAAGVLALLGAANVVVAGLALALAALDRRRRHPISPAGGSAPGGGLSGTR